MIGIKFHFESQILILDWKWNLNIVLSVPNQSKNNKSKAMGKDTVDESKQQGSRNGSVNWGQGGTQAQNSQYDK